MPPVDATPTGVAATLARLEQLADQMCHCLDRDCADQVVDEMTQWSQELASAGEATLQVNDEQSAQARMAKDRMSKCMADVYRRRAGSIPAP